MSIDIHKARIFDIAVGIGADMSMAQTAITARSNALIKSSVSAFRDKFIDQATPSIYVLDLVVDILDPILVANPTIDVVGLKSRVLDNLNKKVTSITSTELINIIKLAEVEANTKLNIAKSSTDKTGIQLHNEYRNILRALGTDIAKLFSTKNIIKLSDPESIGQPDKLVYIGKSFSILKNGINDAINTSIRSTGGTVLYGKIKAAGHTSVEVSSGNFRINTPLLSETLLRLEAGGYSGRENLLGLEQTFISKVPLFSKYKVTFNENFSPTATTLLDIGFTFVRPMGVSENSASGANEERKARDLIIENKVFPELIETLKKRVAWLKDNILQVRNSPNVPEYVAELLTSIIAGKPSKVYKDNSSKSGKIPLGSILIPKIPKIAKQLNKVKYVSGSVGNKPQQTSRVNLSSLLVLINSNLQSVISANMGDGNDKKVLNYRSGRFAASAKVERLSESRQGMISAFYSYMKNPYQTFEPGYAQGKPASRDPKLLISKSIREIAATKVANQLRAISV